jgi:hypothetical protein
MATEAARRQKIHISKKQNCLDSNRPSHGRTWMTGQQYDFTVGYFIQATGPNQ